MATATLNAQPRRSRMGEILRKREMGTLLLLVLVVLVTTAIQPRYLTPTACAAFCFGCRCSRYRHGPDDGHHHSRH